MTGVFVLGFFKKRKKRNDEPVISPFEVLGSLSARHWSVYKHCDRHDTLISSWWLGGRLRPRLQEFQHCIFILAVVF